MAYATMFIAQEKPLVKWLMAGLRRLGHALVLPLEASARMQQVLRFQAMSDAELAVHGLTRDDIVPHVFGDRFGY